MPPTQENFGAVSDKIQESGKQITAKEVADGNASDDGKKAMTKKLLVDPFAQAGYDLDGTLKDFAIRLRDGNVTQDQAAVVMGLLNLYGQQVSDLARWGFIKPETKDLVNQALKK